MRTLFAASPLAGERAGVNAATNRLTDRRYQRGYYQFDVGGITIRGGR